MLNDFVRWKSLKKSINYANKSTYHYKTIADIHKLWSDNGVYKDAYEECNQKKNISKENKFIELLIDSTLIINKSGIEGIGYGTSCRKKKFTKLTALSNLETNNIAIIVDKVYVKPIKKPANKLDNKSTKKSNNKSTNKSTKNPNIKTTKKPIKKTIKTLSHDTKNVEPIIENVRKSITRNIKIKLYGDKGYVMKKTDRNRILKKHNVKIIHSKRRNQKEKNMKKEEETLTKRYKIENMFAILKSYPRSTRL